MISISSDRSVRVWLLRDSGQYWPSICHYYTDTAPTCLSYCHERRSGPHIVSRNISDGLIIRLLFVGLDSGAVDEWEVARDYNSITSVRKYHAHLSRVEDTCFSPASNWILSCGRDKYFYFHCTVTGKRLGGYLCNAWCTGLAYDEEAQYVFVGDYSGAITVCKLEQSGVKFINTLKVSIM